MTNDSPQRDRGAKSFEDLWIWQKSRELVKHVYRDFGHGTPALKGFGFRGQIQSAAVSIMNNITEGFERRSQSDFARFLDIAKGSCGEVRSMYYAAEDLNYVADSVAAGRRETARRIAGGIQTLANHLRRPPPT